MAKSGSVWLITGCSSGFGAALAEIALRAGHKVIGTARDVGKASRSYPGIEKMGGKWLRLDVTDLDTSQIVDQAIREAGRIDVIVNNAGYSIIGALEDMRYRM